MKRHETPAGSTNEPQDQKSSKTGAKSIASELSRRIRSGELAPGGLLPTERALQAEFGAARSTVRRALALLGSSGDAHNVPSRGVVASPLLAERERGSREIALVDGHTYVLRVLQVRMGEMLRERGYHLVHLGGNDGASMEDPLRYAAEKGFAGALVWPFRGFPDAGVIDRAITKVPTVVLDHPIRGVAADLVTFDYFAAGETATNLLIEAGAKRVGVTGIWDMLPTTHDRFAGYMKALFDAGLQPRPTDFLPIETSGLARQETELLRYRLLAEDAPDALLILQDTWTPYVAETALYAGRRLPEDLALATIGDETDLTVDGRGLSTVALDWDAFAVLAVERLLARIESPSLPATTLFAPQVPIVRGLCGAPPAHWTPNPNALTGFHTREPYPRSRYRYSSLPALLGATLSSSS